MRVKAYSSLSELPRIYDDFFSRVEKTSVFFARSWFERTSEHFLSSPDLLRLYGVENEEDVLALFIAVETKEAESRFSTMKLRTLQGCTTTQSFRSSLLIDSSIESDEDLIVALFSFLRGEGLDYQCIDIDLLCLSDARALRWAEAIRSCGLLCHVEQQEWNRYEDVSETPFSKLAKKSTRRRERKLAKTVSLRFEMFTSPEDMALAQSAYEDIYRRTWKKPDVGREFAADLIVDFARQNWVRFLVIYADDKPIAAECFFVHAGIANSFRTAYDLGYRDYSVGSIVLQRMIEHVMGQDAVREIDFGPGDEPYKKQWLSKRRKLWRLRAYDERLLMGRIGYGLRVISDEVSRAKQSSWVRRLRQVKRELSLRLKALRPDE
jgi:hypothetical protein